jgi:hypothetical protein
MLQELPCQSQPTGLKSMPNTRSLKPTASAGAPSIPSQQKAVSFYKTPNFNDMILDCFNQQWL